MFVGLGIAFLLFMAFLNVGKSGNLLNETNLLFAALIFFAGAGALYLGFGVTGTESYVKLHPWLRGRDCLRIPAQWHIAGMNRDILLSQACMKCCLALCGRLRCSR